MTKSEPVVVSSEYERSQFLRKQTSERKLRLFAAECLTAVTDRLTDEWTAAALDVLSEYLDGRVAADELREVRSHVSDAAYRLTLTSGFGHSLIAERFATLAVLDAIASEVADIGDTAGHVLDAFLAGNERPAEEARQATLLQCIFGSTVAFAPNWRSETAIALATGIYAERAFDRLPILADALEEAGCDQADVLTHCRGLGPHARGCWVVDAVLGMG